MKITRRLFLGHAGLLALATEASSADTVRRESVAEVGSIRLELEQPSPHSDLAIRVHDFRAGAHGSDIITCDLYYVADDRSEHKTATVTLRRSSHASDAYSASWSTEGKFTHGTIFKVVYQSPQLRLPISTWYAMHFH